MKLVGRLKNVIELTPSERDTMFALMERHYEAMHRDTFEDDLREKQWVIQLLVQSTGELCGFSTQMTLAAEIDGRPVKALFSGDTIIDRRYWGDQALMYVGGRLALSLADAWPDVELYWFLISQGYKTYRFLPVFFDEFFPRYDRPTPERIQAIIDELACQKFSDRYDSARGIIRAHGCQYRLREGMAGITAERLRDPHVRFFAQLNPGHATGDELCCLARLSRENFTSAAHRILESRR